MAMNVGGVLSDSVRRRVAPAGLAPLPSPERRCRTGSRCGRRRSRSEPRGTADALRRPLADEVAHIRTDPRFGRAAGTLIGDAGSSRRPHARRRRAAVAATSVGVRVAVSITRAGRLCAVNTTSSSGGRLRLANALGERVEQQRMCVKGIEPRRGSCRQAAPARPHRSTLTTLSVENCGASGMPMMRVTPLAAEPGDGILDERLPVAHADRDRNIVAEPPARARRLAPSSDPSAASARRSPRSCGSFRRRAQGRRPSAAHEAQILRHLVHRRRRAVRHQQHAGSIIRVG